MRLAEAMDHPTGQSFDPVFSSDSAELYPWLLQEAEDSGPNSAP